MSWATALFGPTLFTKQDFKTVEKPTDAALAGVKFVALYFSAHWCGPCKRFTPALGAYYEEQGAAKEVEVVFVTADHDNEGFEEYYAEMPWAAVPFNFDDREAISDKFQVEGIPRVVILNATTGEVVNDNARMKIVEGKKLAGLF